MSIICVRRISDVRRRILHGNPSAQRTASLYTHTQRATTIENIPHVVWPLARSVPRNVTEADV